MNYWILLMKWEKKIDKLKIWKKIIQMKLEH